ncbi:hypothetical protein [Scytonema sp. PCC 10023]|uniref:hypothetical protein n=1 Tax=Scytonema sp. PCC 10023 TaxID=1680591 RepID=UPI0039C640A1
MKNKRLSFRLTERRYHKLLLLSVQLDRTMSSLVDEWIDSLPEPKVKAPEGANRLPTSTA